MMEAPDIRNVLTPISLGGNVHPARALWKRPLIRSTSTPLNAGPVEPAPRPRHLWLDFGRPSLDRSQLEPSESPILFARPKVNLASVSSFGRPSLGNDSINTSAVASTLRKMELCDNNYDSNDENGNFKKGIIHEVVLEESTSSFHAHEQFKKQMNKSKKKRKSISPKNKSPKVYRVGHAKKIVGIGGAKKKIITSGQKVKSPKNRSPKSYKLGNSNNAGTSGIIKKGPVTNTQNIPGAADKISLKKSSSHTASQHPSLKTSRCPKSPKLLTAARAKLKQQREESRKEKEKELELRKHKMLEEQKRFEEEQIMKMRQQTVFKAKPIRKYAPLPQVKKRALTDPISPNISKRRRIEQSHDTNSNRTE